MNYQHITMIANPLDDLKTLDSARTIGPPSPMLSWFTIAVAVQLYLWLVPLRWLRGTGEDVYLGLLALAVIFGLLPLFWGIAQATRARWGWCLFYLGLWVYCLVAGMMPGGWMIVETPVYYGVEGEMSGVTLLLLVCELHRHRSAYSGLWLGLAILAQAYLLQWFWIELLYQQFSIWINDGDTINRYMVMVPLSLGLLGAVVVSWRAWWLLPNVERVAWLLLIGGLYAAWMATGYYWWGDQRSWEIQEGQRLIDILSWGDPWINMGDSIRFLALLLVGSGLLLAGYLAYRKNGMED